MAEEIEQDEIDTTEEKAKAIGKDIGVEEEEAPDYEIVEEKDTQEDERIAKSRHEKVERKTLTNKEKRDLRKKRVAEKFSEKDQKIEALEREAAELRAWKEQVDGRLSGINKAEVDNAFNVAVAAFNEAEAEHAAAFTDGDGAKATKAMRAMYDAQKRIDQIQAFKAQIDKQPAQQTKHESGPDPILVNKAKAWAAKHGWYKGDGSNEESAIAKAISGTLANEGYDPKSDDFWDELDDRLQSRGIGNTHDESEEEDEVEEKPIVRKRTAPPINGGTKRSDLKGKKTITLPTSFINTLKANGIWDDLPRRNKIIADRERIIRESAN